MSIINTNMASLNAQRNLKSSGNDLNSSLQRLSSGMRVNSAKDDAAGLSIASKMDSQIRGMNQAIRNANDGISRVQTADGALQNTTDALQRMRELAVQGANETNGTAEWANINTEMQALNTEVARIKSDTKFNGTAVLLGDTTDIQVGADSGQKITITSNEVVDVVIAPITDAASALAALGQIDITLAAVNTERANLGTVQNRMGYAISNLQSSVENQSSAKSRIMDTDFAAETGKLTRAQILQQAGTAMLAQANTVPNGVMALLRG
ncbi:flagellin [Janthinobacterium sp. CG_23.3]|uniref:flagellin N-terminal helical domain-containing protein n=1 Tax=unclassified Janthinobacterium TaxID=2610881 RepID=UPI000349547B|nr:MULTISPECIES: flagellin [unclassified Janthinobacterium]MEC5163731.1 flagellin [Janthinobacterium sp. CG_S6]